MPCCACAPIELNHGPALTPLVKGRTAERGGILDLGNDGVLARKGGAKIAGATAQTEHVRYLSKWCLLANRLTRLRTRRDRQSDSPQEQLCREIPLLKAARGKRMLGIRPN
jgi:hypothetical protein